MPKPTRRYNSIGFILTIGMLFILMSNSLQAVLDLIHKADLRPNIVTYGVLALAYTGFHECRELLATMRSTGHEMNKYVADAMLSNAFRKLEFPFILELMEIMYRQGVRLDEETYEKLDEFQQRMSRMVKEKVRALTSAIFKFDTLVL